MKQKTLWCCVECGHAEPKWTGQCSSCEGWNTFQEEVEVTDVKERFSSAMPAKAVRVSEVEGREAPRIQSGMEELDRLLGGGVVKGSLTLVGGDPGIGKSTLLLQVSQAIAKQGLLVLYICGEESAAQTSLRAKRLNVDHDNLLLLSETNFSLIKAQIDKLKPDAIILDSVQIAYKSELPSAPGSVSQVREVATEMMHLAKGRGISTFLIGHVTKSGEIAGPRVLEHLVDTVLYFEGDKQHNYRMLRSIKNRFGSTDEIAVFQMQESGLDEVKNPSEIFLQERTKEVSGSVIIPTMEGTRPILVEVQALVTSSAYGTPSRRCAGIDQNRLALLLAVMEKRVGFVLHNRDVFVSVAGGIKVQETAADLAIILAIASSLTGQIVNPDMVVAGEVGLSGEIRSVPRVESRIREALQMGFKKCMIPKRNMKKEMKKIELVGVDKVEEAIKVAIG